MQKLNQNHSLFCKTEITVFFAKLNRTEVIFANHTPLTVCSSSSSSSRGEFSALHARNWTWRALHCQSLKHKLKKCDLSLHLKEC